jgi:hypothetical protein
MIGHHLDRVIYRESEAINSASSQNIIGSSEIVLFIGDDNYFEVTKLIAL